jgi:hypothetical protein
MRSYSVKVRSIVSDEVVIQAVSSLMLIVRFLWWVKVVCEIEKWQAALEGHAVAVFRYLDTEP